MDLFTIYLPIAELDFNIILLISIGFCVGTLGGFFGVGGAWIVTPALNIFGFRMAFAIGTDLAHIFGKSIIATKKHSRLGNVDWRLGMFSIVASVIGIEIGKRVVLALEKAGNVGDVVRWVYMIFLFGLGFYMVYDYATAMKRMREEEVTMPSQSQRELTSPAAVKLRQISLPPRISLPTSGIEQISFWVIFAIFLLTGFISGFMGVGGGFILLPALIYLVGCPTTVAVGTSLLSVCFMAGYGCFSYSMSGRTELIAAMIMLIGAAVGAQIGVMATRYVHGYGIRILFAIMILLAGLSVALKQAQSLFDLPVMGTLAGYCVMSAAGGMTLLIFVRLLMGIVAEKSIDG
jgi:uncharacterized membrane protein YfcA